MIRKIILWGFVCLLLILLLPAISCSDGGDESPAADPPQLLSSSPGNGQDDVGDGLTEIILSFNQNVTLASSPVVTLNGEPITDLRPGTGGELKIIVPPLEPATSYTLVVAGNTIKGPSGVFLPTEIRLLFSTRKPVPPREGLSPQAEKLLLFLNDQYGKAIISGTMANVSWNSNEAKWVHQHTGQWPAINCFDYIHHVFSPANWIDYGDISVVEEWWSERGLVSMMWHWIVPANSGEAGKYSFYWGSKPEETLFDISKINDPSSEEYKRMIADIDKISGYLKLLKDKHIPVIWRPLHEAAGNIGVFPGGTAWFWWGAGGAEPFKELWQLMFDRMTNHHGLDNLIWVWTSQMIDVGWYPGDDYVDIVGGDIYEMGAASAITAAYSLLKNRYGGKPVALSECGGVANISDQWHAGAKWSWFMTWYDYDRTSDTGSEAFELETYQHADAAWWREAFNNSFVLTRADMPDLK